MERPVWTALLLLQYVIFSLADNSTNPEDCCRVSHTIGLTYDCSNCKLTSIPANISSNVKTLILKNNKIKRIEGSPFKGFTSLEYLDISYSEIANFDQDAFVGLSNLKDLKIQQETVSPQLPDGLFAPLIKLQSLCLGCVFSRGQPFPGNWIHSLNPVLQDLELSVPPKYVFSRDFARFKNLNSLIVTGNNCRIYNITRETFQVFSNISLKTLEVKSCYLQDIASDSLSVLQNLETINVACNYHKNLDFGKIFEAAKNLPTSSLHTIVVDGSGRKIINQIRADMFNSSSFANLKRLSMRSNRIYAIDVNFLRHVPSLEHINLGFNTIIQIFPVDSDHAVNLTVTLLNNMNITTIDISFFGTVSGEASSHREKYCRPPKRSDDFFRKPPSYISVPTDLKRGSRTIDYTHVDRNDIFLGYNVPLSAQYIYAPHIGITKDEFYGFKFNQNNLLHIDFSHNQLRSFNGPLEGFDQLQGLDVNSCGLVSLIPNALSFLPKLISLGLSKNSLTFDLDFLKHVGNNTSLKFLDLSYNLLTTVKNDDFCFLKFLEVLNLSSNPINEVYTDFAGNKNLKALDLSNCSLTSLSERAMSGLDVLHERSNGAFRLDLRGNPWACNCETIDFLQWMNSTEVNIMDKASLPCLYDNNTFEMRSVNTAELFKKCYPKKLSIATVVAVPSLLILASLLTTSLSFHYRWTLKWKFYLLRRKFRVILSQSSSKEDQQRLMTSSSDRCFDAFVSYNHDEDYTWVQNDLLSKVEDSWNFKLCVGQRDFMVGVPIAENICEAIDNSRYTIIVLTPAFLSSGWCDFELHMALTRGYKHLIILYKEEINISETTNTLRTLLKSINYIEYSESADGQAVFWQRLQDALMTKSSNVVV